MLNHPSQGSDDAQDEKQGDFPVIEEEKTQAVTLKDSYVSDDVANPRNATTCPLLRRTKTSKPPLKKKCRL